MKPRLFCKQINRIENARDFTELGEAFMPVQQEYGIESFVCGQMSIASKSPPSKMEDDYQKVIDNPELIYSNGSDSVMIVSNLKLEWLETYKNENYIACDPVLWASLTSFSAFEWDTSFRHPLAGDRQHRMMAHAEKFGIHRGWVKPIHGPGLDFGTVVCIAGGDGTRLGHALAGEGWVHLEILVDRLFRRARALKLALAPTTGAIALTRREQECLRWSALGKTAWEVGQILGISERTINFHLANAMKKYGVHSKSHAISLFLSST